MTQPGEEVPRVSPDPKVLDMVARYAPVIRFDVHEPFLPKAVGYTIFWTDGDSRSFPRRIEIRPPAELAIEYAIWWDWDIGHLYELEHVWVYVDGAGRIVDAEASWHGAYRWMRVDGRPPLENGRLVVYSEPGKHAFAPTPQWLLDQLEYTLRRCRQHPGMGGVWVTPLFEGRIRCKTPQADRLVHTYLERHAFTPGSQFTRRFIIDDDLLLPWPILEAWIPQRVNWWVEALKRTIALAERRFLRIAHRGASTYAPENTLAAFRAAAERGADMIEIDVRLSADKVPIVIHDAELSRTTNGTGLVQRKTLAQLKALDAGGGERIPTLAEAIDFCHDEGLGLYIELKDRDTARAVLETLRQQQAPDLVIIGSFHHDWVRDVKTLAPKLLTSLLFRAIDADPVILAQRIGADYVHPCWEHSAPEPHRLLTPEWVERVRAAELGLISWSEERLEEIAALREIGVDGICSGAPELLQPVV